jgi:hypothetical protein
MGANCTISAVMLSVEAGLLLWGSEIDTSMHLWSIS